MNNEERVVSVVEGIDGWLFPDEIRLLYQSALKAIDKFPGLPIVEIGSYRGRSTVALASAVRDSGDKGVKVHAIDPHEGIMTGLVTAPTWNTFCQNIESSGVSEFVVPMIVESTAVRWSKVASMVFIDGLHTAEGVIFDYMKFYPYVPVGGLIAFHDYANPDYPAVRKFVDSEILAGRLSVFAKLEEKPGNTLIVTQKSARLSIIIPTIGRTSLVSTLQSIIDEGGMLKDEILVVGDGPQPDAAKIAGAFGNGGRLSVRYFEHGPHRKTGGPQRNFAMSHATGTHLIAIDDDDVYINAALLKVRVAISVHPTSVLLFKEESKVERHPWGVVWKDKEIRSGNVGTQMIVAPNIPGRVGRWGDSYENDYDFIRSTVDLLPRKDDDVVWMDQIIVELH